MRQPSSNSPYQIDEDACNLLQKYIESLRSSFGRQEGGDEIVDDIEARIAELFDELKKDGIEAITIDDVKAIITRIGEPEQLAGEEEKENAGEETRSAGQKLYDNFRSRTAGKRLFRNPKDKMIAGFTFRPDDWESPFGLVSIKAYIQELKGYLQQQIYELEYKVSNCNDTWFVHHYGKVDLKACATAIDVLKKKIKICDWFIDNGADTFYC